MTKTGINVKKFFYNYYLPFRYFFSDDIGIEKISKWYSFKEKFNTLEQTLFIIPLMSFDLIGLDIRFAFRECGFKRSNLNFLLIGTTKQINFALSHNDHFLRNTIYEITLPHDFDSLEYSIRKKIKLIERNKQGE